VGVIDEFRDEVRLMDGTDRAAVLVTTAEVILDAIEGTGEIRVARATDPDTGTVVVAGRGSTARLIDAAFEQIMRAVAPALRAYAPPIVPAEMDQLLKLLEIVERLPEQQLMKVIVGASTALLRRADKPYTCLDSASGEHFVAVGVGEGAKVVRRRYRR
jgi:hypothetical protein